MSTDRQTTADIFMVRPADFGPNQQTAASNAFQRNAAAHPDGWQPMALAEFDEAVKRLRAAGVNTLVYEDTHQPAKPDAVFPNNWISTHDDGTVFLYPMQAENRRAERREDIVERLSTEGHFHIRTVTDLSALENQGKYLEGTGSMVLDRTNHLAYAALSSRTHPEVLGDFAQLADYEITAFPTAGPKGQPIYHTNVMMSIGSRFAVLCADAISDDAKRQAVRGRIAESGRQVIEISLAQTQNFAGNMIELATKAGDSLVVMSDRAHSSLTADQLAVIEAQGQLLTVPIDVIENVGGGSVRCMIVEIFLPRSKDH